MIENSATMGNMETTMSKLAAKRIEKFELMKKAGLEPEVQKINILKSARLPKLRKSKSKVPQFYLGCSDEYSNYVEGSVKQGLNAENVLRKFKEKLLERELNAAKSLKLQNERKAKADRKKEDDAANDK